MRIYKYISLIIVLTIFWAFSGRVSAKRNPNNKDKKNNNHVVQKTAADPSNTILDINNITSWSDASGFQQPLVGQSWNGTYPKGTDGVIYQEGIVWGGLVHDGGATKVRVGGNTYNNGTTGLTRIFRVRPDYKTADLSDDAANFFQEPLTDVTSDQINQLRAQYAKDWQEWPANLGAPWYVDTGKVTGKSVRYDDAYDPNDTLDIPGIPKADQTMWTSYSDPNSVDLLASDPIGIVVNETWWGYTTPKLANCTFKKVDIIYTGTKTTQPGSYIDSMYITQWSDPDVGNSTDDYAGCDTALNLGYAYNSTPTDIDFAQLGLPVPAVGYDFLQGVSQYTGNPNDSALFNLKWRKGYKYVNAKPMSGFEYFAAGGTWDDPDWGYPNGDLQFYNLQRGYLPRPYYPSAVSFPASVMDKTPDGTFLVDGDPVQGTGKLDGSVDASGDRRIMVNNGPFKMQLGDTAEVVVALVGGIGTNNISSISVLKYNDTFAQFAFDKQFDIPSLPKVNVTTVSSNDTVSMDWGEDQTAINTMENTDHSGYEFEGYNIYQLPKATSSLSDGVLINDFDKVDLVKVIFDDVFDQSSGYVISKPVAFGTDHGVQRNITIAKDYINNTTLKNGQAYYYAVTAYAYSNAPGVAFHVLESSPTVVSITPHGPDPGNTITSVGNFSNENVSHSGSANASIDLNVVDPSKIKGHQYQVSFHNETYSLGSNGKWTDITAASKKLHKNTDLTGSYISSAAGWTETPGMFILHYLVVNNSPNYDYIDGVKLQLPSGFVIDSVIAPVSGNDGSTIPYTYNKATNTLVFSTISPDSLIAGDSTHRSQNGIFAGGEDIQIISKTATLPIITNYTMYDDNWGDVYGHGYYLGFVDVNGVDTLNKISTVLTQHQWNITDMTSGNIVVQNQTIYGGIDIYAPKLYSVSHSFNGPGGSTGSEYPGVGTGANKIFDGIQIGVNGSFSAPTTITSSTASVSLNGTVMYHSTAVIGLDNWHDAAHNFAIADFTNFGFSDGTAASSDPSYGGSGGVPLTDIADLQQDYQLRFTGVVGDTTVHGVTIQYTKSGGQLATIIGASGYSLADHPLNPNYGTDAPFQVRIPFEVWNVDKGEQVNLMFWDREGDATVSGSKVWNTDDRVYAWVVNTKYDPSAAIDPAGSTVADSATWNWVFWLSKFTTGDVVDISYPNPLQVGKDTFTFTVPESSYSTDKAKEDVSKINVFPNPYYGFQSREVARQDHYVTFSHLPNNATIRIFDLSGVLVRTIHHTPGSQYEKWDLQNDHNYPVASGIYVAYIDMPGLGKTKVLKLAVIQEEQILNVY